MNCNSYCSHGGVCILDDGHEGLHDSEYCKWSDAEALTKGAADAIFLAKAGKSEVAQVIADLT